MIPQALIDALINLGIQSLVQLIPEIGDLIVQAIVALLHSITEQNSPTDMDPVEAKALGRAAFFKAQSLARGVVQRIEGADWGTYLVKEERDRAKADAAWHDYSGQIDEHKIIMSKNEKESLLKLAVAAEHSDIDLGQHA